MSTAAIPFLDLITPHVEQEEEFVAVFREALRGARFIGGANVENFEKAFALYCEAKYCIGVANGTDALRFAYIATGVGAGDIALTVPNTFIATSEAITQVGAQVDFIDVDEKTYTLDPAKLREYLNVHCEKRGGKTVHKKSGKTVKAVVPVHLYGQCADMDAIGDIASEFGLIVIEDACQAHGAKYFSKKKNAWLTAGSIGIAAAFSFYPGKNLGALGEGGAITCNDESLVKTIKMLREHGQSKKYIHDIEGYNGRLDAIQGGFLSIKLKRLPDWTRGRQSAAAEYKKLLDGVGGVVVPFEPDFSKAVYHLFVIRLNDRDGFQKFADSKGIGTGLHYPVPLHLQKAYEWMNYKEGSFPVSEKVARQIVSLPMFPNLTLEQVKVVCDAVREWVKSV